VPQGDGAIFDRQFKSFYEVTLDGTQFWVGGTDHSDRDPACGADRVRMLDNLMRHLNALVDPALADLEAGLCRLAWNPSGAGDDRMINRIRLRTWPAQTIEVPVYAVGFSFATPFPYAMDVTEHDTTVGASTTVVNPGTAAFYPVFRIHGACNSFTLSNVSSGLDIHYDSTLPGGAAIAGGHYVEIDTFRNTVFLDGSGANRMASIDVPATDFWQLLVGSNELSFTSDGSATCEMLWNPAWA
jgi:hypothetical protein